MKKIFKLTKTNVLQTGIIFALLYFGLCFIILLLFALFGIAVGNDIKLFLVPVMSLIYSIIGFVSGCLISFIYNLIAKKIPLEIELEETEKFSE